MANRMTLYKLVVLGDGGVGKTALTIQVRQVIAFVERNLSLPALPESLRRDVRPHY
jgi:hypothetical protein